MNNKPDNQEGISVMRIRWVLMLLLVPFAVVHGQDSPCNQGRAVWPRVDPRYDWLICVPEIGRQRGIIGQCQWNVSEGYGGGVAPLGRLTPNGPYGWIVTHKRCDTTPSFQELLLYRSAGGQLPDGKDYERIGPREILSDVQFLAAGDWDNSGTEDLCCRVQRYGDTSAGNHTGYEVASVVIFWADSLGHYSIDDTTRLECDAQMWLGIKSGLGTDRNGDGIDDLFIITDVGLSDGKTVEQARGRIYFGHHHKRWGRDGVSRAADWRWWNIPNLYSFIKEIDQDGDGHKDVAWFGDNNGYQTVSVWYGDGKPGIPDTSAVES
ncbi:MAG TPA: hypothetical protein VHI13_00305, partial [Candidatus Kapabacteria bacterium]|nr:hypothetical protein [Candidatus Kapabacteria bacterium]